MTLNELCDTSRKLANDLFRTEGEVACANFADKSCVQAEEERPLTAAEKKRDWYKRPFYGYDAARMCDSCAAYWFAEMAAQTLHRMHCNLERCAATRKRLCELAS